MRGRVMVGRFKIVSLLYLSLRMMLGAGVGAQTPSQRLTATPSLLKMDAAVQQPLLQPWVQ